MKKSNFFAYSDIEIGDSVLLNDDSEIFEVFDIRTVHELRYKNVYFKFKLKNSKNELTDWTTRGDITFPIPVKVFFDNDREWIVSRCAEEAYKWYLNKRGFSEKEISINDFEEVDIETYTLCEVDVFTPDEYLHKYELTPNCRFLKIPMKDIIIRQTRYKGPYVIASTEY